MAHKNRLIPFKWLPASWGLTDEYFDRAEAHYLYDGYDLDRRLAEIELGENTVEYRQRMIDIDHHYGLIDAYERDIKHLEFFEGDEEQKTLKEIEIEIAHEKIPAKQGEKLIATLKNEPWVAVINDGYDPYLGTSGFTLEFDWNDLWIEELKRHGYHGLTEEDIVEQWFQEVCRTEANRAEEGPIFNGGAIWVR